MAFIEKAVLSFPPVTPGMGITGHPGASAGMTLTNADYDHQHMFFRDGTRRTHNHCTPFN